MSTGHRQFTRRQRLEILTWMAQAARKIVGEFGPGEAERAVIMAMTNSFYALGGKYHTTYEVSEAIRLGTDLAGPIERYERAAFPPAQPASKTAAAG